MFDMLPVTEDIFRCTLQMLLFFPTYSRNIQACNLKAFALSLKIGDSLGFMGVLHLNVGFQVYVVNPTHLQTHTHPHTLHRDVHVLFSRLSEV